jgi:hypothetical protein
MKPLATLLILASLTLAQTTFAKEQKICQDLDATIDRCIKNIALIRQEGDVLDKSVAQQTARYININNYFNVIHISLSLQTQNKCPVRKTIIDPYIYRSSSLSCLGATIGSKGNENKEELCDIKNWKEDSKDIQQLR